MSTVTATPILPPAPYYYSSNTGKVYVFHGGTGGLTGSPASPAWSAVGENTSNTFGYAVAGVGDVNGDGYADLAASAKGYSSTTGKVYVFYGGAGGLAGTPASPAWSATGENASDQFGYAVAGLGDVNGDGYPDFSVGATWYSSYRGKVYVFYGGGGRPVLARQLRSDGATAVPSWGLSYSTTTVLLHMTATGPSGRQRARLEVHACPPGVPFGNDACTTQTSADLGGHRYRRRHDADGHGGEPHDRQALPLASTRALCALQRYGGRHYGAGQPAARPLAPSRRSSCRRRHSHQRPAAATDD